MNFAMTLGERQSTRVIERAIHSHAQAIVEPVGLPDRSLLGFVSSGDREVLLIEATGPAHPWLAELVGRCCGVQLFVGERYLFNGTVIQGPAWHSSEQLALQCPRTLQVAQRRRFWRAQLAPSSQVSITAESRTLHAHLLNVSGEGLACKLQQKAVARLAVGSVVKVQFTLPLAEEVFCFRAVVRNHTPTVEGDFIVGMEFAVDPGEETAGSAQQALRDLLYCPPLTKAEAGRIA